MKPISSTKIFIYAALPCEAKPLIDFFKLKKDLTIKCFAIYSNDKICLTVTGIGKSAMAAGIAYTQALFSATQNPTLLNIGIAGHKEHPIGSIFLIDKITDVDSDRRYYPPLAFTPPCPTHSLQTTAKPQYAYPTDDLCDMEASAFYETATRFASGELSQCLKIVSDNESSSAHNINPKQVSGLISAQLSIIDSMLAKLTRLVKPLVLPELAEFDQLCSQYRFTTNEQLQLKKLLTRWHLVKSQSWSKSTAKSGNEFLELLKKSLDETTFYL
jgi:adenosylhomocysteine nucleosidase